MSHIIITSKNSQGDNALRQHQQESKAAALHQKIQYHTLWKETWEEPPLSLTLRPTWKMTQIMKVIPKKEIILFWESMRETIQRDMLANGAQKKDYDILVVL